MRRSSTMLEGEKKARLGTLKREEEQFYFTCIICHQGSIVQSQKSSSWPMTSLLGESESMGVSCQVPICAGCQERDLLLSCPIQNTKGAIRVGAREWLGE